MKLHQTTRIISVTGTKGKTSVVRALCYVLNRINDDPVLGVDTHRIMIGDQKLMSYSQSVINAGLAPTVCPGRFLYSLVDSTHPIAILEVSLSSSRTGGVGYRTHEIGIFTNVYDDHMGSKEYIRTREDIAREKSFIFRIIKKNGFAIFNADNDLVVSQLRVIDQDKGVVKVGCTLGNPDILKNVYDYVVSPNGKCVHISNSEGVVVSVDYTDIPWLRGGDHEPSLYNGIFVIAAIWVFLRNEPQKFVLALKALANYMPDDQGGRMVLKTAENNTKVILDFAHEAESLSHIGKYAHTIAPGGRVLGVVRLSGQRPDSHILSTTQRFAPFFDELFIYDKEDEEHIAEGRSRGDVSRIMLRAAQEAGVQAKVVSDDKDALTQAYRAARPEDIIVYIIRSSVGNYELADSVFHFKKD